MKYTHNLHSTKGMGILSTKLQLTQMAQVTQINMATAKMLHLDRGDEATLLQDMTINTKKCVVYVSDSDDRTIVALTNGKASLVPGDAPRKGINGLLFEQDQLVSARATACDSVGTPQRKN